MVYLSLEVEEAVAHPQGLRQRRSAIRATWTCLRGTVLVSSWLMFMLDFFVVML